MRACFLLLVGEAHLFGEVLRLPQWLQNISPFEHLAFVPAEAFAWGPFVTLSLLAVVLSVAGQLTFARRDIA